MLIFVLKELGSALPHFAPLIVRRLYGSLQQNLRCDEVVPRIDGFEVRIMRLWLID